MMNNKFQFIGRITKDLELRSTSSGKSVLEVNMAVNINKDETLFITPTLFGVQAETMNKYCKKGDMIAISGIIKNHNWDDKEGKKHYDYQFLGNEMLFLQTKKEDKKEQVEVPQNTKSEYDNLGSDIKLEDKDLPF